MNDGDRARATLQRWRRDPIAFVREEFRVEPDAWQKEALAAFPHVNRLGFKACKGPGKTTTLAWLMWNFLATRPHPRIGAVSITGANLSQNLWPELAKWQQVSPFLTHTFAWSKTAIVHRSHPSTWWAQARSWAKQGDLERQADALAGLHADYAMAVLDEGGGIPQGVMATAEAVLAGGLETKVLLAGNPTHTTGPLHRACTVDRHLWKLIQITGDPNNPKRSPRVSIEWARQQIQSYGRDNPWVLVNVFGEFPPSSINALLGVEEVQAAMARHLSVTLYAHAQKRLGVDVARFGDDRSVIFPRQGLAAFKPIILRHQRTTDIAARVVNAMNRWESLDSVPVELVLIDDTGHWGHGVVDNLTTAGIPNIAINYAGKALDPRYKNRRVEMWLKGAEAIRAGAALPPIDDMVAELTEPTYTFVGGQFVLEEKDQVKARLQRSPDLADAYMNTYAIDDLPAGVVGRLQRRTRVRVAEDAYRPRAFDEERDAVGHAVRDRDVVW